MWYKSSLGVLKAAKMQSRLDFENLDAVSGSHKHSGPRHADADLFKPLT